MSVQPENEGLAPASGGVSDDGVRELFPVVMWDKTGERDDFDFRGIPEEVTDDSPEEDDVDPKVSSATNSALSAIYETLKTPSVDWSGLVEARVSAGAEPSQEPNSETGLQAGSSTTSTKPGKSEPSAEK